MFSIKLIPHERIRAAAGQRGNRLYNHGKGYFNDDLNVNPPRKIQKNDSN